MGHDDIDALLSLPINERGGRLAQTQENQWFERKSIRIDQKSFAKAIIGMANAEGGTVVVGLSEKRVEGTNSTPSQTNRLRQVPMTMVAPPLRVHFREVSVMNDDGAQDHLLVTQVPPSRHAHRRSDGTAFLRMGDSTVKLDGPMWEELVYDREAETYEAQPAGITMADLSGEATDRLRVEIGAHGDDIHVLRSRSLLTHDGKPTIAALLLFGAAPAAGTGARPTISRGRDRHRRAPNHGGRRRSTPRGHHPRRHRQSGRAHRPVGPQAQGPEERGDLRSHRNHPPGRLARGRGERRCPPLLLDGWGPHTRVNLPAPHRGFQPGSLSWDE